MKTPYPISKISAAVLLMACSAQSVLAATNKSGPLNTSRVDYISVNLTGSAPVIDVSAKGNKYDTVESKHIQFGYNAKLHCKPLWDVHYMGVALGPSQNWYDASGKAKKGQQLGMFSYQAAKWDVDTGKRTLASGGILSGKIPAKLEDVAVKACQNETQKIANQQNIPLAEAMSQTRTFNLKRSGWIYDNLKMQAWGACGNAKNDHAFKSVYDKVADIKVKCKAKIPKAGFSGQAGPGGFDHSFQVTKVNLIPFIKHNGVNNVVQKTKHVGSCPVEVTLSATITANKAGSVKYRWKSGNSVSQPKHLTFTKAGTRNVKRTLNIENNFKRTQQLQIMTPHNKVSNTIPLDIKCVQPIQAEKLSDLTIAKKLTIGNKAGEWGINMLLNANGISDKRGNSCALRLNYKIENIGEGAAANFATRVKNGAAALHTKQISQLKGGKSQYVGGKIYLSNGKHTLISHVDYGSKVTELKENNNIKRVNVTVTNCGDNRQPQ